MSVDKNVAVFNRSFVNFLTDNVSEYGCNALNKLEPFKNWTMKYGPAGVVKISGEKLGICMHANGVMCWRFRSVKAKMCECYLENPIGYFKTVKVPYRVRSI